MKKYKEITAALSERARRLTKNIPILFMCLKDWKTPVFAKITAFVTVAYALSPVDLIPDFIPVLGYLDDLIILPVLVALTVKLIPDSVWNENAKRAEGSWTDGKPEKWYFAVPIIIVWLLIAFVIIKAVFIKR